MLEHNGTDGRAYGGDHGLIHVPDGRRAEMGRRVAAFLDRRMRQEALGRSLNERLSQPLCPGCYMVVMFDALVELAHRNDQPREELARTMRDAFQKLLDNPDAAPIEEIHIQLDPTED